jgi:antitoxin (DNA-binding transcriptional repressor) of toxin-antitoxin stability system
MKTITIRELLHNPTRTLRVVERGGTVRLTRRGQPVARLIPEPAPAPRKIKWPDFAARAKAYCGDFVLSDEAWQRMKDAEERKLI